MYKLDRWAISSYELLGEAEELDKKGVSFISPSENIDISTRADKLDFQIFSTFATFERNLICKRTLEGLKHVKAQGKTLGRKKGSSEKKKRRKSGYWARHGGK